MRLKILMLCAVMAVPFPSLAAKERPSLITESFYASERDQNPYGRRYYDDSADKLTGQIWNKLLIDMGIQNPVPTTEYRQLECRYDNAVLVLQDIRKELGPTSAYQKLWAQNQDRVFSACDSRKDEATSPVMPTGDALPKRAVTDYYYQQASWYFYRSDLDKAKEFYEKVIAVRGAPMRPYASYMLLRTLRASGHEEEAYNKIDAMLADQSLRPAHSLMANYRFIMGWYGSGPNPEKHLKWLISRVRVTPEKAADLKQSFSDYFDAMEQLNAYFPFYDTKSKTVDWWLTDVPLESKRMEAVRKLAPQNELIDWMQAKWAYNIFNVDWLWGLHRPENVYWKQNERIVAHAWKRWHHGDGLEWLQIAAQRVQPKDPLAANILNDIAPYLTRDWKHETDEYQAWLLDMWAQSIRLHLGREDYEQAIALIDAHADFKSLAQKRYASQPAEQYQLALNNTMRWLLYTGHADEGRKALAVMLKQFPNSFQHWRTLLATTKEELIAPNKMLSMNWYEISNSPDLWREMVNNFSTKALYELAGDASINEYERAFMARSAITRAILLGAGNDELDKYAILAAKLNPSIRERLLAAVAGHKFDDYIAFLLRTPRFRPVPYLEYVSSGNDGNKELDGDLTKIDVYNHNDNNWWCRVDAKQLDTRLFDKARIAPGDQGRQWQYRHVPIFLDGGASDQELEPYLAKQRTMLAKHPYHQFVDEGETKALEAIASGPEYLTKAAIKQAGSLPFNLWGSGDKSDLVAANLYSAVRTTRYGCQRNGSHVAYSHEAYDLLHKKYGDSTWAKATPYWFGCSHFREGCPKAQQ